jgi:cytochrome c oxidase subunit 2
LDRKHRFRRAGVAVAIAVSSAFVLASCGDSTGPKNKQNALRPAGPYSKKILDLTEPFFWIAVVIGIAVVGATIYVALRFREKPGQPRNPKQLHGNTALEISWTIIPALILAAMAVPTVATIFDLAQKPKGPDVVHITVSARQWWWQFEYNDPGNDIITANEMHIPVGVPVSLSLVGPPKCTGTGCYANGVIHSFWIPALNGKKDVVPGRTQFLKLEASKPGTYTGQCAEYCGLSHANMRMRVVAQPMADYQAWVRQQLTPLSSTTLKQFENYNKAWTCLNCHSDVPNKSGAIAPNITHIADRCAFAGDTFETNEQNLTNWIYNAPSMKPMQENPKDPLQPLVGMPNFSSVGMTKAQANEIAKFLLSETGTGPVPPTHCTSP